MDKLTLRRIQTLHPAIREDVREAYLYANNRMLGRGVRLRFSHTYRSKKEQNELYSYGRTKFYDRYGNRLGKVTYVKGGYSIHNYGLAWDILLLLDKNHDGKFEKATWDTVRDFDGDGVSDWMECVEVFKKMGAKWGGDWKRFKDKPHFQFDFGFKASELKKLVDSGRFFTEEIGEIHYKYPVISK